MYTTWPVWDGSPGLSGTARAAAEAVGVGRGDAELNVRRSFWPTAAVYARSSVCDGTGNTLTEPRTACTNRPTLPGAPLVVPVPDPAPRSAPTARYFPSGLTSRLDGYHAVGMRPRKSPWAASLTSKTATALAPPSATYKVRASGERASAVGASPICRSRNGAIAIRVTTLSALVSITVTESELPSATNNRPPDSFQTIAVGWRPVVMSRLTRPVTRSTRLTVPGSAIPRASMRTASARASQH